MPKGLDFIQPGMLEKLKSKLSESLPFTLHSNKNFTFLSQYIFERTGSLVSASTLRRVFQYRSDNKPTLATLDLICRSIGYAGWIDFHTKEQIQLRFELSQSMSFLRLNGIGNRQLIRQILHEHKDNLNIFALLDTLVQIALLNKDREFLESFFDFLPDFEKTKDLSMMYFLMHNLVIGLKQTGMIDHMIPFYGSHPKAQLYLVEWFVDEDNLDGYYYDLLQVYHQHKTDPQALLFYYCMMYQHAMASNQPVTPWAEKIRNFGDLDSIHHIPRARRLGILLCEAIDNQQALDELLNETADFLTPLSSDGKCVSGLYICRVLFKKRFDTLIPKVLALIPDQQHTGKDIFEIIHINQLSIYRAFNLCLHNKYREASQLLSTFKPIYVDAFMQKSIMHDFGIVKEIINKQ